MAYRVFIGITLWMLYILSCYLGTVCFMAPSFLIMCVFPKLFRCWNDLVYSAWTGFATGILEVCCGTKVFISGDIPKTSQERCLIIMNHRTRQDWLLFWTVCHRYFTASYNKIILRGDLRRVPGLGWSMQMLNFMFLDRRWEKDQLTLGRDIEYFNDLNYPIQLLLFPEGTNYEERACERSNKYAVANGLTPYKYCLHPRVTGFTFVINKLRERYLDAVYDVTVGYPKNMPQSELTLLAGIIPQELHYHMKRYDISELPTDTDQLSEWCKNRWAEKEERLQQFYTEDKAFNDNRRPDTTSISKFTFLAISWNVFIIVALYAIYSNFIVRYYIFGVSLLFIFFTYKGGVGPVSLQLYYYWYKKRT